MITITLTNEEAKAVIIQLSSRIDELKEIAVKCNNFNRIMELVPFIANIESAQTKIIGGKHNE